MTRTSWTHLALAFALLLAPVVFLGCAEQTAPTTPATGTGTTTPVPTDAGKAPLPEKTK
jgi:hypothetical protein